MRIDSPMRGERILVRNYEKSDLEFLTGMWFHEENGKYKGFQLGCDEAGKLLGLVEFEMLTGERKFIDIF